MLSKKIRIGNIYIGGGAAVAVQSMTNTDTKDVDATVSQMLSLQKAGCEIIRSAVYDTECASFIPEIKKRVDMPFVADIHFDHRIAVAAIKNGADKVRINPGNIGGREKVLEVVKAAKDYSVPIRVGGNTGSLPEDVQKAYGVSSVSLIKSAERNIEILEDAGFSDIVVSLKSSNVKITVDAYRQMAQKYDYPLHLGITEAGTYDDAAIKSAMGIGALLLDGIGDTLRVSVTGDPVKEIYLAKKILKFAGMSDAGVEVISCPTCARCSLDLESISKEISDYTKNSVKSFKVAVMGCAVNGPGEAKDADFGIAGGNGSALLFKRGEVVRKIKDSEIISVLKGLCDEYGA